MREGIEGYERRIDLIDYIEVLLKRKWLIIGGTLLCAVVTGISVLSSPPQYEARALIVVSPSITSVRQGAQEDGVQAAPGTDIVVPGLAAETYEALAKGDELLYSLKDSLLHVGLDMEITAELAEMDLEVMAERMLEAGLLKETQKAKSPLLAFRAQSSFEQLPVAMVNLWATLFVERNRGLSSNVADDYYQWVQAQYDIAKEKLERTEDKLREIKAAYHSLNVLETEIAIKTTRLDTALIDYQSTAAQLEAAQQELQYLQKQLASVALNGAWLGYTPIDELPIPGQLPEETPSVRRDLIEALHDRERAEGDSLRWAEIHEERRRQFKLRRDQELLAFEQQTSVDRIRKEMVSLVETIDRFRTEATKLDQRLKDLGMQLEVNRQNRLQEPRVLTVSKAISDEALWKEVIRGDGKVDEENQEGLGKYRLISEQINPTHQELSATIRSLQVEYDRAQTQVGFFHGEIPVLEERLLETRAKLDTIERPEAQLLQGLERELIQMERGVLREAKPVADLLWRKRDAVARYEVDYSRMRQRAEALERSLIGLANNLGFEQGSFESWSLQIQEGTARMDSLLLARTRLERDETVFQRTFARFANLVEEARIARVQAAGDIQMVSRAVVARRVARGTVTKASIAGIVGLMVSVMLAFTLAYVGRAREQGNAAGTDPTAPE